MQPVMKSPDSLRSDWETLNRELDRWAESGRTAWFWWRDDDAADVTPALDRLLALHRTTAVPLTIAVVPRQASQALAERLDAEPAVTAAQHGFAHVNHSAPAEKKCEFPGSRAKESCLQDLRSGQMIMRRLFPQQSRQILVPPWNRLPAELTGHLPHLGFTALSQFQLRQRHQAAPGLVQINTHIDPVDWKGQDSLTGCRMALASALRCLQAMRLGAAPQQPLGLLTHHLRHDAVGWDFVAAFLSGVQEHPASGWLDLAASLDIGAPRGAVMPPS